MYTYNCYTTSVWKTHWMLGFIFQNDVKPPKAPKKLGKRRRYNDSTIPPLDFRLCPKSPV